MKTFQEFLDEDRKSGKKSKEEDKSDWDADDLAGFTTPEQRAVKRRLNKKTTSLSGRKTRPNQFK